MPSSSSNPPWIIWMPTDNTKSLLHCREIEKLRKIFINIILMEQVSTHFYGVLGMSEHHPTLPGSYKWVLHWNHVTMKGEWWKWVVMWQLLHPCYVLVTYPSPSQTGMGMSKCRHPLVVVVHIEDCCCCCCVRWSSLLSIYSVSAAPQSYHMTHPIDWTIVSHMEHCHMVCAPAPHGLCTSIYSI